MIAGACALTCLGKQRSACLQSEVPESYQRNRTHQHTASDSGQCDCMREQAFCRMSGMSIPTNIGAPRMGLHQQRPLASHSNVWPGKNSILIGKKMTHAPSCYSKVADGSRSATDGEGRS